MNELNLEIQEKAIELIKRRKKELSRIKRDWQYAEEECTDIVSNKTYNSEYELNNDMRKIRKIINEFGDKYDDFLTAVHKEAKKILEQGADHTFVKDIIDLIEEVFELIGVLSFDFSTHSYSYEISSELNEIKKWWTDKYKNMLEALKLEKMQAERKKREKEKREKEKEEEEKNLDIEFERWKKEVKEIKRIRSKKLEEYNQKIDEEEKAEKIKYEKNRDKAINDFEIEIKQLKDRIEREQQELVSLGIFKFKRKEELIISIGNLREKIRIKEEDVKLTKNKFLNSINDLEKKTVENKANYEIEIRRKYPITANPEVILRYEKSHANQSTLTKTQSFNNKITDAIFEELLRQDKPMSIQDLMYNSVTIYELAEGSNQKVSALITRLKESGKVIRITEGKKALFMINYDRYMEEFDE